MARQEDGGSGYISDKDEQAKRDTDWSFVDDDGTKVFQQEPAVHVLPVGSCISEYSNSKAGFCLVREATEGSIEE